MEQIYNDVELGMSLLKVTGVILLLIGCVFIYKSKLIFLPYWKNVFIFGCIVGAINAGLVLSFGGALFFLTPTILAFFALFYSFNKFPRYMQAPLILTLMIDARLEVYQFIDTIRFLFISKSLSRKLDR